MGQITVYDLMDSNGKFDYGKYREAANNWSKMRTGAMKNIMQDPTKQAGSEGYNYDIRGGDAKDEGNAGKPAAGRGCRLAGSVCA